MKLCPKCNTEKDETEFNSKNKKRGTLQSFCKECNKEYHREHYKNNKQDYLEKARRNDLINRNKNHTKARVYFLQNPCIDCGETDPIVLQFDHINGNKTHNVSNLLRECYNWNKIQMEIDKCEVRCANCHLRKTAREFGWYKYMNESA